MVRNMGIARDLGYLRVPPGLLVDAKALAGMPPEEVVLISTGSQGEPMAALSRMANRDHRIEVADLTASGIGLEGVRRILELEHQLAALQARGQELAEELAATREALRQAAAAFGPVFAALALVAVVGAVVLLAVPRKPLSTARPAADRELARR